jgi:hypothetical protein
MGSGSTETKLQELHASEELMIDGFESLKPRPLNHVTSTVKQGLKALRPTSGNCILVSVFDRRDDS